MWGPPRGASGPKQPHVRSAAKGRQEVQTSRSALVYCICMIDQYPVCLAALQLLQKQFQLRLLGWSNFFRESKVVRKLFSKIASLVLNKRGKMINLALNLSFSSLSIPSLIHRLPAMLSRALVYSAAASVQGTSLASYGGQGGAVPSQGKSFRRG